MTNATGKGLSLAPRWLEAPSGLSFLGSRLVSKDDEAGFFPLTKTIHVVEKSIDVEKRTVDFVASTDVVDAHDEIVDQASWQLDDFLKNPVVLFAHLSRELPIGRSIDVAVRNSGSGMQLETRIEFASAKLNPKADQVFEMIREKFLRAVSVGFMPKSYRWEMRGGQEVWVWSDCVLKEISVTPVPANPQALAKMKDLARREAPSGLIVYGPGGTVRGVAPRPTLDPKALAESLPPSTRAIVERLMHPTKDTSPAPLPGTQPSNEERDPDMDLKDALEKLDKQNTTIAELKLEAKTAGDKAEKAEARVVELEGSVKTLAAEKAALELQSKTNADARDAAVARAEKAEGVVVEQEVEALVGKKITPAMKDTYLELRRKSPELFAKMVEQLAPLNLDAPIISEADAAKGAPKSLSKSAQDADDMRIVRSLGKEKKSA